MEFELLERDGLGRIGRFLTPHGEVMTPALLPVVHPDPARQPVTPQEIRRRFGASAVITSAYITHRTPALRERALTDGIHKLLGFNGAIMTDSGAFQQHAYGYVEVEPEAILDFQNRIGTDIATVLDRFTEPGAPIDHVRSDVEVTTTRARQARERRPGLLAVPVQGADYSELRALSAAAASRLGDVLAIGGVVPLLERYDFARLAEVLAATRPHLNPACAVHLFGSGHPMTFAIAALFGVDLFDSSAYQKFARRGDLLFPEGTVSVDDVREAICPCVLCDEKPLVEVARLPPEARQRAVALHNLSQSFTEIARIRQAVRDGTLWELVERRAAAHPSLRAGVRVAKARPEVFLPTEPESRRAFREISPESRERPAITRFRSRLAGWSRNKGPFTAIRRRPLTPPALERLPVDPSPDEPAWYAVPSPIGPIPFELSDLYPVGPYLGDWTEPAASEPSEEPPRDPLDALSRWTMRQVRGLLEWRYGSFVADALVRDGAVGQRSRRTGRLRWISDANGPLFHVGDDSIPRPTWTGAHRLHRLEPPEIDRVEANEDAAPFVAAGRSLFARFVVRVDPQLVPGASALVVGPSDRLLAVGRLLLAPHEMSHMKVGVVARITAHARSPRSAEGSEDAAGVDFKSQPAP